MTYTSYTNLISRPLCRLWFLIGTTIPQIPELFRLLAIFPLTFPPFLGIKMEQHNHLSDHLSEGDRDTTRGIVGHLNTCNLYGYDMMGVSENRACSIYGRSKGDCWYDDKPSLKHVERDSHITNGLQMISVHKSDIDTHDSWSTTWVFRYPLAN